MLTQSPGDNFQSLQEWRNWVNTVIQRLVAGLLLLIFLCLRVRVAPMYKSAVEDNDNEMVQEEIHPPILRGFHVSGGHQDPTGRNTSMWRTCEAVHIEESDLLQTLGACAIW